MYLDYFLMPLLATAFFIVGLYPFALKIGFTDKPCHRKQHRSPTPLIGGMAIYLSIILTLCFNDMPLPHQAAYMVAATLLVFVGLVDDYRGLGIKIRLVAQVAAALIMVEYANIRIDGVGDLLGFGPIHLGLFGTAFTVFAVVGGINAFNMVDGIDGLAGSLSLVAITALAAVSWLFQEWALFKYCLIVMATITVFLLFNLRILGRKSARIFLGDTGSTLLGFTICWLAIDASQDSKNLISPIVVPWVIALPLADSVCIMLRRLIKGRSPFNPDREHLHHLFNVAGYSVNETLGILVALSAGLAFLGIFSSNVLNTPDSMLFLLFMTFFVCHYWSITHAWTILKISRYLRETSSFDRRTTKTNQIIERRSGIDRRHIPSRKELDFYRNSRFPMASLFKSHSVTIKNKGANGVVLNKALQR